jgi:hypothetical protein
MGKPKSSIEAGLGIIGGRHCASSHRITMEGHQQFILKYIPLIQAWILELQDLPTYPSYAQPIYGITPL